MFNDWPVIGCLRNCISEGMAPTPLSPCWHAIAQIHICHSLRIRTKRLSVMLLLGKIEHGSHICDSGENIKNVGWGRFKNKVIFEDKLLHLKIFFLRFLHCSVSWTSCMGQWLCSTKCFSLQKNFRACWISKKIILVPGARFYYTDMCDPVVP